MTESNSTTVRQKAPPAYEVPGMSPYDHEVAATQGPHELPYAVFLINRIDDESEFRDQTTKGEEWRQEQDALMNFNSPSSQVSVQSEYTGAKAGARFVLGYILAVIVWAVVVAVPVALLWYLYRFHRQYLPAAAALLMATCLCWRCTREE